MMRHSLFFTTIPDANKAERFVTSWIIIEDIYQSNDGESRNIEVRFFTEGELSKQDQEYILQGTRPVTYALNCEVN